MSTLKIKMRAASHKVTWQLGMRMPETFPFVFVVGYPRSGTTWASQLLAECFDLPWPKLSLLPVGCPAVVHGHQTMDQRYPRAAYVMRDGRDVLVSCYFYLCRQVPEGDNPPLNRRLRRALPGLKNKDHVLKNMPRFIERQVNPPESVDVNWAVHVRSFLEGNFENTGLLRYERLLSDGVEELTKCIVDITGEPPRDGIVEQALDKFSFARRSGRKPGQEDRKSFLRGGRSGDWRRYFTREAAELFDHHFGDALIAAGYEQDHSWVEQCGADQAPAENTSVTANAGG